MENAVGHPRSWQFICGPNRFFHVFRSLSDPIHHLGQVPAKARLGRSVLISRPVSRISQMLFKRQNDRTLGRFTVLMCPRAVPSLFLLKQQRQTVTTILPTCSLHRTPLQSSVNTLGLCAILAHFQMSEDWMEIRRRLKTLTVYRSASTESVSKRARRHFYFFIRPPHKLLCAPRSPWIANTASVL
jgi:hypothetical protein